MSWPDSRPGEPADPNRPWHWVTRSGEAAGHPLPIGWNTHLRHWVLWDGSTIGTEDAARRFAYVGPCLTPAETQAALAEAVAAATPAAPPPEETPRGLAALAASAVPDPPPAMVYRKDAVRMHLMIFAGTLIATVFLAEKFVR
jgi:hypothetical protein